MSDNNKQVILAGIKPTRVHLGHLISVVDILKSKYKDEDKIVLIGDYHRMFYEQTFAQKEIDQLIRILNSIGGHTFMQSAYAAMFANLFFRLAKSCKLNHLNKVFKINFDNQTENTLGKMLYPFLMAIDIALCAPCKVMVSQDQIHNIRYVQQFIADICKEKNITIDVEFDILNIKILSILDEGKMSTSSAVEGALFMDMSKEEVDNILLKAKTQTEYVYTQDQMLPNTLNLFNIFAMINNETIEEVAAKFTNFKDFKAYAAKRMYEYLNGYLKLSQDTNLGVSYKDDFITKRFEKNFKILMN